jgi:hypothetical protein
MNESERLEKSHTLPGASPLERYRIVRSQIEHEDNVISQRLNWFVAGQSFLFTANAMVLNAPPTPLFPQFRETVRLLTLLIPIVAVCSCLMVLTTVIAGALALRNLREFASRQPDLQEIGSLPPIHGGVLTRTLGLGGPLLLLLLFLIVWMLLLVRAVRWS